MDSQTLAAVKDRPNDTAQTNVNLMGDALLLLSRLFGRQAALDFMRDTDILTEGDSE